MQTTSIFDKMFGRVEENEMLYIPEDQLEVLSKLGEGGFGIVYKGLYREKEVAIKSLSVDDDKDSKSSARKKNTSGRSREEMIEDFLSEAQKMNEMHHPNIVRFIGCVLNRYSIVMEYCPLGPLNDYIRKQGRLMPWLDRYHCALDVAQGMAYLHSKVQPNGKKKSDIFHQDLKTANVLLCRSVEGRLTSKIADFGLSVLRERKNAASPILTQNATHAVESFVNFRGGTVDYFAPELLSKDTRKFTKACDVYAFGVVMYELGTLRSAHHFKERRKELLTKDPKPTEFFSVIWSCTHTTASSRPPFSEIVKRLEKMEQMFLQHDTEKRGTKDAAKKIMATSKLTSAEQSMFVTNHFTATSLDDEPSVDFMKLPHSDFQYSTDLQLTDLANEKGSENLWSEKLDKKAMDAVFGQRYKTVKKQSSKQIKMMKQKVRQHRTLLVVGVVICTIVAVGVTLGLIFRKNEGSSSNFVTPTTIAQNDAYSFNDTTSRLLVSYKNSACTAAAEGNGLVYFGFEDGSYLRTSLLSSQPTEQFTRSLSYSVPVSSISYDKRNGFVCIVWRDGHVRIHNPLTHRVFEDKWDLTSSSIPGRDSVCRFPKIYFHNQTHLFMGEVQDQYNRIMWPRIWQSTVNDNYVSMDHSNYRHYIGRSSNSLWVRSLWDEGRILDLPLGNQTDAPIPTLLVRARGIYIYILRTDGTLTKYLTQYHTFTVVWSHPLPSLLQGSTTLVKDMIIQEAYIYLLTETKLLQVSANNPSEIKREYPVGENRAFSATRMVISGGFVFYGGANGQGIYVLNLRLRSSLHANTSLVASSQTSEIVAPNRFDEKTTASLVQSKMGLLLAGHSNGYTEIRDLTSDSIVYKSGISGIPVATLDYDPPIGLSAFLQTDGRFLSQDIYGGDPYVSYIHFADADKINGAILNHPLVYYIDNMGIYRYNRDYDYHSTRYASPGCRQMVAVHNGHSIVGYQNGTLTVFHLDSLTPFRGTEFETVSNSPILFLKVQGLYLYVLHQDYQFVKYSLGNVDFEQKSSRSIKSIYKTTIQWHLGQTLYGMHVQGPFILFLTRDDVYQVRESDPNVRVFQYTLPNPDGTLGTDASVNATRSLTVTDEGIAYIVHQGILQVPLYL